MSTLESPGPAVHRRHVGFVREHPALWYFVLTFALSWSGMLAAVLLTPGGLSATPQQLQQSLAPAVAGMLLGPPIAGLLMTWLVDGRAGLHQLRLQLTKVRVGLRWYAVALLLAPVTIGGSLLALSLVSRDFLPHIVTAPQKLPLLLMGLAVGGGRLLCGDRLDRLRHSAPPAALGGPRHRPPARRPLECVAPAAGVYSSGVTSHEIPLAVWALWWLPGCLVGQLVAFRVLMVWVHERTGGSLFLAMVTHASLTYSTIVLFPPLAGVPNMIQGFVAAATWAVGESSLLLRAVTSPHATLQPDGTNGA